MSTTHELNERLEKARYDHELPKELPHEKQLRLSHEQYLLKRASQEIKDLRQQLQISAARLAVFDNMVAIFNNQPMSRMGMTAGGCGVTYEIDNYLDNLPVQKEETEPKQQKIDDWQEMIKNKP